MQDQQAHLPPVVLEDRQKGTHLLVFPALVALVVDAARRVPRVRLPQLHRPPLQTAVFLVVDPAVAGQRVTIS
jgi:hypothetical protein